MRSTPTQGLVSIIMASYNHADYLTGRMDSLICQTYENIEIIVIDDCSTDNSLDILRKYQDHKKVRLIIREANGGWINVFNQGIELSKGEFILFANCDDECDPEMIAYLVQSMSTNPSAGVSYCRSVLIDKESNVIGDDYSGREVGFKKRCTQNTLLKSSEALHFFQHSCIIPNTSAALIRKECFDAVGFIKKNYTVCADWELYINISKRFDIAYISIPLNRFRIHRASICGSAKERIIYEEYFRLLLGTLNELDYGIVKRGKYRYRVMYLWAFHVLTLSKSGLNNLKYHSGVIAQYDMAAFMYMPIAFFIRFYEQIIKYIRK